MGLLTTNQKAAIANGVRVKHLFRLLLDPWEAGGLLDTTTISEVPLDIGEMESTLYNVSLQNPGDLSAQVRTFEFSENEVGNVAFLTTIGDSLLKYAIRHEMWLEDGSGQLPCSMWVGRIIDVQYKDRMDENGVVHPVSCTLTAEGTIGKYMRQLWTRDHGDDITKPHSVSPSGLVIDTVSSGWDNSGGFVRVWVQLNSSSSCTSSLDIRSGFGSSGIWTSTPVTGGAATTHQLSYVSSIPATSWGYGTTWSAVTVKPRLKLTRVSDSKVRLVQPPEIPAILSTDSSTARPW